jgi:hypothetical protein
MAITLLNQYIYKYFLQPEKKSHISFKMKIEEPKNESTTFDQANWLNGIPIKLQLSNPDNLIILFYWNWLDSPGENKVLKSVHKLFLIKNWKKCANEVNFVYFLN